MERSITICELCGEPLLSEEVAEQRRTHCYCALVALPTNASAVEYLRTCMPGVIELTAEEAEIVVSGVLTAHGRDEAVCEHRWRQLHGFFWQCERCGLNDVRIGQLSAPVIDDSNA